MMIITNIEIILAMPFKGLFPKGIRKSIKGGYFFPGDFIAYLVGFIRTIVWWSLAFWIYSTISRSDNSISKELNTLSRDQTVQLIIITCGIVIGINIIVKIISKIMFAIYVKTENTHRAASMDMPYRGYIPVGCRACGGPYPNCKTSCNLFDE